MGDDPASQREAQQRADRIRAFREELADVERAGAIAIARIGRSWADIWTPRWQSRSSSVNPPRYADTLCYGHYHEPWIAGVRAIIGK
jgi:hypothetical protein